MSKRFLRLPRRDSATPRNDGGTKVVFHWSSGVFVLVGVNRYVNLRHEIKTIILKYCIDLWYYIVVGTGMKYGGIKYLHNK